MHRSSEPKALVETFLAVMSMEKLSFQGRHVPLSTKMTKGLICTSSQARGT